MRYEYYFSKTVDVDTWKQFIEQDHKGTLNNFYHKITGYGWKDNFGFNYNGEAIYISEHGFKYKGIWFETENRRIAVFKQE